MASLSCEEARDLTADLALGTISGDDRARILGHIGGCAACRQLVDELSGSADALLLLAPEHEPPAGFESEVLARMRTPVGGRRVRLLGVAAALLIGIAGSAAFTLWSTAEDRELGEHYRHALEEANGEYFGVRRLVAPSGTKIGNLFLYTGHTDWAFVVFDENAERGSYRVDVKMKTAGVVDLGRFELSGDERTWGRDVDVDLSAAEALRFHSPSGDVLVAAFR